MPKKIVSLYHAPIVILTISKIDNLGLIEIVFRKHLRDENVVHIKIIYHSPNSLMFKET